MPLAADHEMVVDRDAERFGGLANLLVISMSSRDGLGSPLGWLWSKTDRPMTLIVFDFSVRTKS